MREKEAEGKDEREGGRRRRSERRRQKEKIREKEAEEKEKMREKEANCNTLLLFGLASHPLPPSSFPWAARHHGNTMDSVL